MADSWQDFEKYLADVDTAVRDVSSTAMSAGADLDKLAALHERIAQAMGELDAVQALVEQKLAEGIVPAPGEQVYDTPDGKRRVIVTFGERHKWDQDKLRTIVAASPKTALPMFIEEKLMVDKRAWDRATPEERAEFMVALSKTVGGRKIKVEKVTA